MTEEQPCSKSKRIAKRSSADVSRTICWTCRNAVPSSDSGCDWSRSLIPVKGWDATERQLMCGHSDAAHSIPRIECSYTVHSCPDYIRG